MYCTICSGWVNNTQYSRLHMMPYRFVLCPEKSKETFVNSSKPLQIEINICKQTTSILLCLQLAGFNFWHLLALSQPRPFFYAPPGLPHHKQPDNLHIMWKRFWPMMQDNTWDQMGGVWFLCHVPWWGIQIEFWIHHLLHKELCAIMSSWQAAFWANRDLVLHRTRINPYTAVKW